MYFHMFSYSRTNLPDGFGGYGGGFLVVVAVVALPLLLSLLKPPPGPPKPPGNVCRGKILPELFLRLECPKCAFRLRLGRILFGKKSKYFARPKISSLCTPPFDNGPFNENP